MLTSIGRFLRKLRIDNGEILKDMAEALGGVLLRFHPRLKTARRKCRRAGSKSSRLFIRLHPNGNTKQLRVYNKNLTAKTDIEYSVHQGKMTFHAHDYVNGIRQPARSLTSEEKRLYGKYFGGTQ